MIASAESNQTLQATLSNSETAVTKALMMALWRRTLLRTPVSAHRVS
jgi:hypothetical protein